MADVDSTCLTSRCSVCRETKAASEFNRATHHKNGLSSRCKTCNAEYCARYKASGGVRKSHAQRSLEREMAPDRLCPRCMETKPKDQFGRSSSRNDGLRVWCKPCHNAANKAWRTKNPDKASSAVKAWQKRNPDKVKAKFAAYVNRHPGRMAEHVARWRENNPDRAREIARLANQRRRATVFGALNTRIGNAIRACLSGSKAGRPAFSLLPYSPEELRLHIERQFHGGMNWDSFLRGEIHIDHIRPLASFDFSGPEDDGFMAAWSLSNLRPLWAKDNLRKHAKNIFLV